MKTKWSLAVVFVFWCSLSREAVAQYGDTGCYSLAEHQGCDPFGYQEGFESCPGSCYPSGAPNCDDSVYFEKLGGFNYQGFTIFGYVPNGGSRMSSSTNEQYIQCTDEGECICEQTQPLVYVCKKSTLFTWEEYNINAPFPPICTEWENQVYHSEEEPEEEEEEEPEE